MQDYADIMGLSLAEVKERTSQGLVNKSRIQSSKMISHILWENIVNLFNILVAPIIFILIKLGLYREVISVAGLTLANTVIGIFQEIKAKIALDRIALIDIRKCIVIREGMQFEIPIDQVVRGDYLYAKSGEPVLADGTIVRSNYLEIDESMLTGESDYIRKGIGAPLLSGSFCVSGTGVYVAEKIGEESYVNTLSRQAKQYRKFLSPIQRKVNDIVKLLISLAVILTILLAMDYMANIRLHTETMSAVPARLSVEALEKDILEKVKSEENVRFIKSLYKLDSAKRLYSIKAPLSDSDKLRMMTILTEMKDRMKFADTVRSISSIIMTLVPQGLVLSITLIFIVGIVRLSRMGALINKPNSIESMAHVDVLCMDKTGTLTKNKLALKEIIPFSGDDDELRRLLRIFASNSVEKNKTIEALVKSLGQEECEILDAIPFSSLNKYSGLRILSGASKYDLVMGALSSVGPMLDTVDLGAVEKDVSAHSMKGYRVVLFAAKTAGAELPLEESLAGFKLKGMVVFEDEIKPEAGDILNDFQKRNIELKIVSGDHPETIGSIARTLNIRNADRMVTGQEMEKMSPEDFENAVLRNTIFARINPYQKLEIVRALQRDNRYVAMVGDGVNDALAIKEANLGISMGSGARVTKDVSDITLINDTFEIMPGILNQGQIIIQNVKDLAKLFLFKNSFSVILIFITQFLDMLFPFNPQQVTLFNFITITIPSTYIVLFAKRGSEMQKDYLKEILKYSLTAGLVTALVCLGSGLCAMFYSSADESLYQTYIVATICIMGIFNFLYIYAWPEKAGDLLKPKPVLVGLASLAFLPAAMYLFNIVSDFFALSKMDPIEWSIVLGMAAFGIVCTYVICRFDLLVKMYSYTQRQ